MRSMQYLVSMALRSKEHQITRVSVDIADYKKQRASRLEDTAQPWIKEVKGSGKEKHLHPMNAADRRTIHKFASDNGLETISEGEGRERHIILKPAKGLEEIESSKLEEPEKSKSLETEESQEKPTDKE